MTGCLGFLKQYLPRPQNTRKNVGLKRNIQKILYIVYIFHGTGTPPKKKEEVDMEFRHP